MFGWYLEAPVDCSLDSGFMIVRAISVSQNHHNLSYRNSGLRIYNFTGRAWHEGEMVREATCCR